MKPEFKGMFPAPPTPVTEDGRVDEEALRALLEDNMAHGMNGFWMAGSTGEGPLLSDEQRAVVAQVSAETCKGRVPVIMHVGAISTASAVKAAKAARAAGCDAVCCVPPFFFWSTDESRIDHYKAVADARATCRLCLQPPQLTQVETVPAMMEKFVRAIPTLRGLKHSAPNFADIRVFADMGLTCFSGNGWFPLPALDMGAVGTIDAPLTVAPWHYAELYNAWKAGDATRAKALQDGVRKFVDLIWMYRAPAHVCKVVLSARLGIDCGATIPPVIRLRDEEKREVLRVADALGVTARRAPRAAA
jgi:N-acetylneuraminate lyase